MMYIKSLQNIVVIDCPHFYFICLSQESICIYYDTKYNCPVSCSLSKAWSGSLKSLQNLSTPFLVCMGAIAVGHASAIVTILNQIRFPPALRCVSKI